MWLHCSRWNGDKWPNLSSYLGHYRSCPSNPRVDPIYQLHMILRDPPKLKSKFISNNLSARWTSMRSFISHRHDVHDINILLCDCKSFTFRNHTFQMWHLSCMVCSFGDNLKNKICIMHTKYYGSSNLITKWSRKIKIKEFSKFRYY